MDKIKTLGQVYTPENIVEKMYNLSTNDGNIMEPSAGQGAFSTYIKSKTNRKVVSIEIDPDNMMDDFIIMDFMDYPEENKFSTIIANPPYVGYKMIDENTMEKISKKSYFTSFDNRANLYMYFIKKCYEHMEEGGEMIMITPREFIKATSSINLNHTLYENGTITDWYEYGDEIVFKGYSPNVVVWKYVKGDFSRKTNTNDGIKTFTNINGQIIFNNNENHVKFGDLFFVKVGAVSGMDSIFENENGNISFVCSETKKTGKLRKMFYNIRHEDLESHKDVLINRKIKKFDETNWWRWGRGLYESDKKRIYVNCKTRDEKPFFINECKYYDGSVLAIFPKVDMDINEMVEKLNRVDWYGLGFKVGGRYCFTQKSLENTILPNDIIN
jgi:adenine-specific DNA-methyltransferase